MTPSQRKLAMARGMAFYNQHGKNIVFAMNGYQYTDNFNRKRSYKMDDKHWVIKPISFISKVWMIATKKVKKL